MDIYCVIRRGNEKDHQISKVKVKTIAISASLYIHNEQMKGTRHKPVVKIVYKER